MGAYGQGAIQFTIAQNLHQPFTLGLCHKALSHQRIRSNLRPRFKELKITHIYCSIVMAKSEIAVAKTTHERQSFGKTRLTTVKCSMYCATSTSLLALCTATGSLATSRAVTTTNASLTFMR